MNGELGVAVVHLAIARNEITAQGALDIERLLLASRPTIRLSDDSYKTSSGGPILDRRVPTLTSAPVRSS